MDSATTNVKHKRGAEAEFGQEIPAMSSFESKPGPPILPPHLLQVGSCAYGPHFICHLWTGDPEQRHTSLLWANTASGAQPCDDQPPIRSQHQGWGDGDQLNTEVPQEICNDPPLQTHWGLDQRLFGQDQGPCLLVRCHTYLPCFNSCLSWLHSINAFLEWWVNAQVRDTWVRQTQRFLVIEGNMLPESSTNQSSPNPRSSVSRSPLPYSYFPHQCMLAPQI